MQTGSLQRLFLSSLTRRSFLTRCGLLALGATAAGSRTADAQTVSDLQQCATEPGVALLIDWSQGLVQIPPDEIRAPADWVPYIDPNSPISLLIPPDWSGVVGWASGFSSSGAPIWETTPPLTPQLRGVRLLSADGLAAYEYVSGTILGPPLQPTQLASIAQQGILGETPVLTPICGFSQSESLQPSWFTADYFGSSILVTSGAFTPLPDAFSPATVVTYQNFFGPAASYEPLMGEVFLRFLFQLLSGASSSVAPTPTPTPAP